MHRYIHSETKPHIKGLLLCPHSYNKLESLSSLCGGLWDPYDLGEALVCRHWCFYVSYWGVRIKSLKSAPIIVKNCKYCYTLIVCTHHLISIFTNVHNLYIYIYILNNVFVWYALILCTYH